MRQIGVHTRSTCAAAAALVLLWMPTPVVAQAVAPTFAGDTIYAWSEVLEKAEIPGRTDVGALRVRLVGVKNLDCSTLPLKTDTGEYAEGVVIDLDAWLVLPR